jgi:hypothetical protein
MRFSNLFFSLAFFLIPIAAFVAHAAARGDEIILRGGGQVQGKVSPDPDNPERVRIWLMNSKHPLNFEKAQVLRTIPRPSPLDEYLVRKDRASDDARGQFDLGLWCERNKLPGLAQAHYEAALTRDGEFEPAHQKLGHVLVDGRWLTRDQLRGEQGLVKYKGRWITPEEKAEFESDVRAAGAQAALSRRFRLLRQALIDGEDDRRREAESQLMRIRDPVAVGPLVRVFGNDVPERRKLLLQVLGEIPGSEAAAALVARLLIEADPEVRHTALDQLRRRKERIVESRLVRGLQSSNVAVVNRAAWAIGHLGLVSAVPKLIPVLVSREEQSVWTNPNGGLLNANVPYFGGAGALYPYYRPPGALMAATANAYAVLTPPAVGPGAVAYGAYVVPYAGGNMAFSTSSPTSFIGLGAPGVAPGSLPQASGGPVLRTVVVPVENLEVHDALVALTNRDFEYNVAAWTNWLRREFQPNPAPARQVPQP